MAGATVGGRFLVVRSKSWKCALPLEEVLETMRPLPVAPLAGMPPFVRGVSLVRGEPTPVISLTALLEGPGPSEPRRFVLLRVPERRLALEVEEVLGLRQLGAEELGAAPPLLQGAAGGQLEVLGRLDGQLLGALHTARLLPEATWARLMSAAGVGA
jgi:purine-binding chemotaxis protein CheW